MNIYSIMENIIHCPIVERVLIKNDEHDCSTIVRSQNTSIADFQVPEPWRGHIEKARILFVSSNPSISKNEKFPTWNWEMKSIQNFFITCFDENSNFTKDGTKYLSQDGQYIPVRFWSSIKNIAKELIPNAIPGRDYALTEIVHCKSQKEVGVIEACKVCANNYMKSVIFTSTARVIIVLGEQAKKEFYAHYRIDDNLPSEIEGMKRYVVFLPHPNARVHAHKLTNNLTPTKFEEVRNFVNP